MYECFHCLHKSVVWDCDYDFEDVGIVMYDEEGNEIEEGIVQCCHCSNCGAEIEYRIPIQDVNDKKEELQ